MVDKPIPKSERVKDFEGVHRQADEGITTGNLTGQAMGEVGRSRLYADSLIEGLTTGDVTEANSMARKGGGTPPKKSNS